MNHLFIKITNKKFSFFILYFFLGINLFIVTINYIIDPFQIYRKTSLYTFKIEDQRYLNAGLAKNYPYDTLITGSSMVENFYLKDVSKNKKFSKPINLALQGASIYEEKDLLNLAIRSNKNLKNIIFSLDFYSFNADAKYKYTASTFPKYLYDSSIFNDIEYLFNYKILRKSFRSLELPYNKSIVEKNLDSIYNWQKLYNHTFTLQNVVSQYNYAEKLYKNEQSIFTKKFRFKILKNNFDKNLFPILQKNQHINFYIFYPPYSILAYKMMEKQYIFQDILKFKHYIFSKIQTLPNVYLYDFQVAFELTNNLHNYKDLNHYNERINKKLLLYIEKQKYLVQKNNIDTYINIFSKNVEKYTFDTKLMYNSPQTLKKAPNAL